MTSAFAVYNKGLMTDLKSASKLLRDRRKRGGDDKESKQLNNTKLDELVQHDLPGLKRALKMENGKKGKSKKGKMMGKDNDESKSNNNVDSKKSLSNTTSESKVNKTNKKNVANDAKSTTKRTLLKPEEQHRDSSTVAMKKQKAKSDPKRVGGENCIKSSNKCNEESDYINSSSYPLMSFVDLKSNRSLSSFQRLIHPVSIETFFRVYWEQKPLYLSNMNASKTSKKKNNARRVDEDLFSTSILEKLLTTNTLLFTKNIDVTSYTKEEGRETHNPDMDRAYPAVVFDYYNQGCSIRLLNPQTFHKPVWQLCEKLQSLFGSLVGANVYLTPKGSQGFAPHYDDVDVFIIQLEGAKRWRLHRNLQEKQVLDRFSSKNFSISEVGEVFFEQVLNQGDMLYLPRGTIHQAECLDDHHSLHITISTYQRNCIGDLIEEALPKAIKEVIESNVQFRKGLPLNMDRLRNPDAYETMTQYMKKLLVESIDKMDLNKGADAMAKRFMKEALPPCLTAEETKTSIEGDGERWDSKRSEVVNVVAFEATTKIKLLRSYVLRLVEDVNDDEEDEKTWTLYFSTDNSREFMGVTHDRTMVVSKSQLPLIKALLQNDDFVAIQDLPMDNEDCNDEEDNEVTLVNKKIVVVQSLWEKKLVVTQEPLRSSDVDDDEDNL